MATIDDTARPRFLPLTTTRRLEVDYLLDDPTKPVALTVVDRSGREIRNDGEVIALAWRLSHGRRQPRTLRSALRVLLAVAVRRNRARLDADRAARNLAQAEERDAAAWIDEPIDYTVVDQPATDDGIDRAPEDTSDYWESCFGSDPEAPHVYLDDAEVNGFAREQTTTGRVLRALDRAAGGAR